MLSSTFVDLMAKRAHAESEFKRKNFLAVWMENDSSISGPDLIDASLEKVDAADAYFCIVSKRYGKIHECPDRNPNRLSLTELEFERALARKIPISVLVMGKAYAVGEDEMDLESEPRAKLEAFRARVRGDKRIVDEFTSYEAFLKAMPKIADDLRATVEEVDRRDAAITPDDDALSQRIADKVAAALAGQTGKQARQSGLSNDQIEEILQGFGHAGMPEAQWAEALLASAGRLRELEERLKAFSNEEPEIAVLLKQAGEAIEAADFAKADDLLADAERRDLEAGQERILRAAHSRERRGDLALGAGRHVEAADHYAEAARIVRAVDQDEWARLLGEEAKASYERGEFVLDPIHIDRAVRALRLALEVYTREHSPADWAMTQNNLGNALRRLGERGDDAALGRAVEAYRLALEVRTREHSPADWAMTQNNLGNALLTLGERGDDAALGQAVEAYRLALEIYTRERSPAEWAITQNNLGTALQELGERGDDAALEQAVEAYRLALEVRTREHSPARWAMTQNNLGTVLSMLGERGDGAALGQAVEALRLALEVRTREHSPAQWAMTQNNLGAALQTLGERGDDAALGRAVEAYRLALEVHTREHSPADWAMTQNNLGNALSTLGARGDNAALREALQSAKLALEGYEQVGWRDRADHARRLGDKIEAMLTAAGN